jgi:hypothetical protein
MSSGDGDGELVIRDSLEVASPEVFSELVDCRHLIEWEL